MSGAHKAEVADGDKATDKHASEELPDRRSPQQIERDIEAARANLAVTLDEIVHRVKPANLAAGAKEKVRAQFIDGDTGAPRMERIAPIAGGAVALVVLIVLLKRNKKKR